jgi:hypothetical protein
VFYGRTPQGIRVNLGYYEAARIAKRKPALLDSLQPDVRSHVRYVMEKFADPGRLSRP